MSDFAIQVLTPTVVAAVVSAGALIARELLAGRFTARRSRAEIDLRRQGVLVEQVRLLLSENEGLRRRAAECQRRYHKLERRCGELEHLCRALRRRVDRLGGLVASRTRRRR